METSSMSIPDEAQANEVKSTSIIIPYTPRRHYLPIHVSPKRFKFVCMHRRAGKSVGSINEMIKRALENKREFPPPRYGYVGPSFAQTKDLIWGYLKTYAGKIPGVKFSEGDLSCTLPNGAVITLYGGAAAWERMRGLYFDGIMLDEFPLLNPSVFSTVVRPCLADYRGWAIVSGTSNGDDHFNELRKRALKDPDNWEIVIVPVTESDALHPDEVAEMTKDMSPEEYAREMLCSFDAPVDGAYYGYIMNDLKLKQRFTTIPYDEAVQTITWWDLGIDDATAVWVFQVVGKEIRFLKYREWNNVGLLEAIKEIKRWPYSYGAHVFPHDIKARELTTGRSRYDAVCEHLENVIVSPMMGIEDGIQAVRTILPMCWFDPVECEAGISALQNYHKKPKTGKPNHNWASHGSDAFRTGAQAFNMVIGYVSAHNIIGLGGRLRRRVRGVR